MPVYLLAVRPQQPTDDRALIASAYATLGLDLEAAYEERRYLLVGELDDVVTSRLVSVLLEDGVLSTGMAFPLDELRPTIPGASWAIDIAYRLGGSSGEHDRIRAAAEHVGAPPLYAVRGIRRVYLRGNLQYAAVEELAHSFLGNDLVEAALISLPDDTTASAAFYAKLIDEPAPMLCSAIIPLRLADDAILEGVSREHNLALDVQEMRAIQAYFREYGRDPTECELKTLTQTWSEHRWHTTRRALVRYQATAVDDPEHEPIIPATIDGILKTLFVEPTRAINPPWLLSAFVGKGGSVAVGDDAVSLMVETHHPPAPERLDGAPVGMVGDVFSGLGQPLAYFDALCIGPRDLAYSKLPAGVPHPRQVAENMVARVGDYGNRLGIPKVAGTVLYDERFLRYPLFFWGGIGLSRRDQQPVGAAPGDALVVIGPSSSRALDATTVQPVIDVIREAGNERLYHAIASCAVGGLSSAVRRLGQYTGVQVELADVPVAGVPFDTWAVWVDETQGRLVLAVPPHALAALLALCTREDVLATIIGSFTGNRRLVVTYVGHVLIDLELALLYDGQPQRELHAIWTAGTPGFEREPDADPIAIRWALHQLLAHPNIAAGAPAARTYDRLVQDQPVPTPGAGQVGNPSMSAAVLQPRANLPAGLVIGCGINPRYGLIDPYWMALACCDAALRQVVAVGGDPYKTALLDNFYWGDPDEPHQLAGLVRAAIGCRDVARTWSTPFISSQGSLNHENRGGTEQRVAIPPTVLISALAVVPNVNQIGTNALQEAGNLLYLIGRTRNELGGSQYLMLHDELGFSVPKVDLIQARRAFRALHAAFNAGLVRACHHVGQGGLAVAAAEMSFGSNLGLDLDLSTVVMDDDCLNDAIVLFSETPSRFLVEVRPSDSAAFGSLMEGVEVSLVGFVTTAQVLRVDGLNGREVLQEPISALRAAWQQQVPQG